jgi:integrase
MRNLVATNELAPASVARVGEVLSSVFGFAVHEDRLEGNPVAGLAHPLAVSSRERRFDDEALRILWNTFVLHSDGREDGQAKASDPASRLEPLTCLAARFIMVTLCRRSEAAAATWDEFDRNNVLWVVPRERTKSGRTEVKPLSAEAMAILEATEEYCLKLFPRSSSRFVFPSTHDPKWPMADERVTRAITRLCQRFSLPHGSPHDFRRSGATTLTNERYGFSRFIISQVLGHAGRDGAAVTAVYGRNDYLPQKRAALEAWAGHILALGAEPQTTKSDRSNSKVEQHSELNAQSWQPPQNHLQVEQSAE